MAKKEYNVEGTIKFDISIDVMAESEEEAMKLAKEELEDYYHLDVEGANHDPNRVKWELYPAEYDEE